MTFLHLFILGVVQGITEFLPISSSAHLILVPKVMGEVDQGLLIDLGAHAGTLLAVMILFHREVRDLVIGFWDVVRRRESHQSRLFIYLFLATIPAGLAGFLLKDIQEVYLRDPRIIIFTTVIWGAALWWVDRRSVQEKTFEKDLSLRNFMIVGVAQILALIPGTSRSGITMTAARHLGFKRSDAARFSFLLSIPVTAAAVLMGLVEIAQGKASGEEIHAFFIVAGISFVTAMGAIVFLLRWLKHFDFTPFVIYRFALVAFLLCWLYF